MLFLRTSFRPRDSGGPCARAASGGGPTLELEPPIRPNRDEADLDNGVGSSIFCRFEGAFGSLCELGAEEAPPIVTAGAGNGVDVREPEGELFLLKESRSRVSNLRLCAARSGIDARGVVSGGAVGRGGTKVYTSIGL